MFFFQTRPPPPSNEEPFANAYGLAGYRKDAITWRPHLAYGFSLQLPNGWELEKAENSSRATITTSPDLAAFLEQHSVFRVHIATTGVQIQSFNVGETYNLDTDLRRNLLFRSLETQHFPNCIEQDPTVLYALGQKFPAMGLMRHYICDNGYQVIDTIAADNASSGRAMRIRLVGTTAEIKYLLHIPDSVRRLGDSERSPPISRGCLIPRPRQSNASRHRHPRYPYSATLGGGFDIDGEAGSI